MKNKTFQPLQRFAILAVALCFLTCGSCSCAFVPSASTVQDATCRRSSPVSWQQQQQPRTRRPLHQNFEREEETADRNFYIRDSHFSDLGAVSEIILASFYTDPSSPWRQMYRVGELNRLQQNFPYNDELHAMLVAVCVEEKRVIGFVDVDARPSSRSRDPPRPYLSDLAVHPKWRRKGIAKALVQTCEHRTLGMGKEQLYIRVQNDNTPAIQMYHKLNYRRREHKVFGVNDNTTLVHKLLANAAAEEENVLNYVV